MKAQGTNKCHIAYTIIIFFFSAANRIDKTFTQKEV
jgi:hypothetical protein